LARSVRPWDGCLVLRRTRLDGRSAQLHAFRCQRLRRRHARGRPVPARVRSRAPRRPRTRWVVVSKMTQYMPHDAAPPRPAGRSGAKEAPSGSRAGTACGSNRCRARGHPGRAYGRAGVGAAPAGGVPRRGGAPRGRRVPQRPGRRGDPAGEAVPEAAERAIEIVPATARAWSEGGRLPGRLWDGAVRRVPLDAPAELIGERARAPHVHATGQQWPTPLPSRRCARGRFTGRR
jgi:hypothetical protein